MKCPKCKAEYYCPCESCLINSPNELPKWIRSNMADDGNDWDESCPKCGFTQSVHEWLEEEYQQYKNRPLSS